MPRKSAQGRQTPGGRDVWYVTTSTRLHCNMLINPSYICNELILCCVLRITGLEGRCRCTTGIGQRAPTRWSGSESTPRTASCWLHGSPPSSHGLKPSFGRRRIHIGLLFNQYNDTTKYDRHVIRHVLTSAAQLRNNSMEEYRYTIILYGAFH